MRPPHGGDPVQTEAIILIGSCTATPAFGQRLSRHHGNRHGGIDRWAGGPIVIGLCPISRRVDLVRRIVAINGHIVAVGSSQPCVLLHLFPILSVSPHLQSAWPGRACSTHLHCHQPADSSSLHRSSGRRTYPPVSSPTTGRWKSPESGAAAGRIVNQRTAMRLTSQFMRQIATASLTASICARLLIRAEQPHRHRPP
jgi:hypothetical protein